MVQRHIAKKYTYSAGAACASNPPDRKKLGVYGCYHPYIYHLLGACVPHHDPPQVSTDNPSSIAGDMGAIRAA